MESESTIDSALCAGMRDPRERAALFRLEYWYQEFCASGSVWMEVGGAYNRSVVIGPRPGEDGYYQPQVGGGHQTSFHRLLVHRLADRFGIRRESRSPNVIRLYKCPETRIPSVLLQGLDPAIYYPPTHLGVPDTTIVNNINPQNHVTNGNINSNTNSTPAPPTLVATTGSPLEAKTETSNQAPVVVEKQPKKRIIVKKRSSNGPQNVLMQRKPSSTAAGRTGDDARSNEFGRSSSSEHLEAKERAYAEARARIFNDESDDTGTPTDAAALDTVEPVSEAMANLAVQTEAEAPNQPTTPNTTTTASNSTSATTTTTTTESSPTTGPTDAALSNVDRKAVYRNRAEEAADPDFQRGRIRHRTNVLPSPNGGVPRTMASVASYNPNAVYYPSMAAAAAYNPHAPPPPPAAHPTPAPHASSSTTSVNGSTSTTSSFSSGALTASAPVFVPGAAAASASSTTTTTTSTSSTNHPGAASYLAASTKQSQSTRSWSNAASAAASPNKNGSMRPLNGNTRYDAQQPQQGWWPAQVPPSYAHSTATGAYSPRKQQPQPYVHQHPSGVPQGQQQQHANKVTYTSPSATSSNHSAVATGASPPPTGTTVGVYPS